MAETLADQIMRKVKEIDERYHRLLLVVAPSASGKTTALREVRDRTGAPLTNVSLELSRQMLELTERQRALRLPELVRECAGKDKGEMALFDNTEIIFDVCLKQDPLRLLQNLSRNQNVVAAWNGAIEKDFLTYAVPGHPEYRRYPVRDFLVAKPEAKT